MLKALPVTLSLLLLLAACQNGTSPTPGQTPAPSATSLSGRPSPSPSGTPTPVPTPTPDLKDGNLIPNPGAEAAQGSRPANWGSDSFGELRAEFTWREDAPFSGQRYLATHVSNYGAEGDAKWYFDHQRLGGGQWYEYRDMHRSDGRNRMLYSCQPPGGQRRFYNAWQSHASPGWQEEAFRFYLPSDCDVTVIHSLDRNGFLHTDHHSLRQVPARAFKEPMVSITFDDIWKTAVTLGLPELEKRGYKGSFYITRTYTEQPGELYASLDDLRGLVQRGHELGSHSHRHASLSELEQPDLLEDIRKTTVLLKDLGITSHGIAYPFGDFDGEVETEVKRFHSYARTSLAGLNDGASNRYRLRIIPVTSDTPTSELLSWIDAAAATRTWLILLFHDLGDPAEKHPYRTPLVQYQQVLDTLKAKNIKVVTVEQGLRDAGL